MNGLTGDSFMNENIRSCRDCKYAIVSENESELMCLWFDRVASGRIQESGVPDWFNVSVMQDHANKFPDRIVPFKRPHLDCPAWKKAED